jgi:hypothetical protein
MFEIPFHYSIRGLLETLKLNVPNPEWPDPDKEPLPKPSIEQILKKPHNRPEKPPVTLFSIYTETDKPDLPPVVEEKKEEVKKPAAGKPKPKEEIIEEPKGPFYTNKVT